MNSESPFQFESKPFSSVHAVDCFVELPLYRDALQNLLAWLDSGEGVALLTGAPGLGKTLLCHRLVADRQEAVQVVMLPHGHFPSVLSFFKSILFQLDCNYAGLDEHDLRLEFHDVLKQFACEQRRLLLIVDGAHEMSEVMLQEIQNLSALGESYSLGLMVLLAGQLELEELLTRRSLSSLNQRLRTHQILENLTRSESADYLAGRIELVGNDIESMMTEDSVEMMIQLCDGIPRCLNLLAEAALKIAETQQSEIVDVKCVREAFENVRHLPLHWNPWPETSVTRGEPGTENAHEFEQALETEDLIEKERQSVPDLKLEAEEAGVEYAVAEFGGQEESGDSQVGSESETDQNSAAVYSVLDLSTSVSQNEEKGEGKLDPEFSSLSDTPENKSDHPSSMEINKGLQSDLEGLVEMMNAANSNDPDRSHASNAIGGVGIIDSMESPFLQSRMNPIDIFAVDLPEETTPSAVQQPFEPSTESVAATAVAEEVQQIISSPELAPQETNGHLQDEFSEPRTGYDVIEPEAIPEISRIRPSLEIDLPHREPQPRYRNLFRDLRRRRG